MNAAVQNVDVLPEDFGNRSTLCVVTVAHKDANSGEVFEEKRENLPNDCVVRFFRNPQATTCTEPHSLRQSVEMTGKENWFVQDVSLTYAKST